MPRSAETATRFTSTTPHATSHFNSQPASAANLGRPLPSSASQASKITPASNPKYAASSRAPGPAGETPQEKVARLKAAAARGRAAQVSTFDKVLVRGRVWADKAHRFTALSLIGITGIAGVVTVYALGDMMIYNRRKRAEYFAEQKALHSSALFEAQKALRDGNASEEQHQLVEEEFKHTQAISARESKPGMFKRGKEWLFSGLKKSEDGVDELQETAGNGLDVAKDSSPASFLPDDRAFREESSEVLKAMEDKKDAVKSSAKAAFDKERELQKIGGPLDRIGSTPVAEGPYAEGGQYAKGEEKKSGGGWTSFMTRK